MLVRTMFLRKLESYLRRYEHAIKYCALTIAALFALTQYFDYLKEGRVNRSLELYKKYSSEPLYGYRLTLIEAWEKFGPKISSDLLVKPTTPEQAAVQKERWIEVSTRFISDQNIEVPTIEIIDFLSASQICIENRVCDKDTLTGLIGLTAKDFIENNCSFIGYIRESRRDLDFAEKALLFVNNRCNPEMS